MAENELTRRQRTGGGVDNLGGGGGAGPPTKRVPNVSAEEPLAGGQQRGFAPSQMKKLLDEELESQINMWREAKEMLAKPPANASQRYMDYIRQIARDADKGGYWQLKDEAAVREFLQNKRLGPDAVRALGGQILEP